MSEQTKFSRRRFLQKASIGLGAAVLACGGGTALALVPPKLEMPETIFTGSTSMKDKILVTYASKCGSTGGVAEAIGKVLSDSGSRVDIMPVDKVTDLTSYRAVVIGSAIRYGAMLPAATAFIRDHAEDLQKIPVAYFTVCSTLFDDTPENRAVVAAYTNPQKSLVPPVSSADFAGVYDPKKISFAERLLGKAMKMPEGDFRDWAAIQHWASKIAPLLAG